MSVHPLINRFLSSIVVAAALIGCVSTSSKNQSPIAATPVLTSQQAASLRQPDIIRSYHVGPYIDPNDGTVRHDAHDVDRIEQSSAWNLRPNAVTVSQEGRGRLESEWKLAAAELEQKTAEQNRLMKTTITQNEGLGRKIDELNQEAAAMQKEITQARALKEQLDQLHREAVDAREKARQPAPQKAGEPKPQPPKPWYWLW